MTANKRWEHFTHEADIGIRGLGSSIAEAFEMGALALTNVVTESLLVRPLKSFAIQCEAPDLDILFADWINAIIYQMALKKMLFSRFHVTVNHLKLQAVIHGEPVDRVRHQPIVEVKGATYTELKVFCNNNLWTAQCVVDV